MDAESKKGRFGWIGMGDKSYLPYIIRYGSAKFISLQMLTSSTKFWPMLPSEVHYCAVPQVSIVTTAEANLLYEIRMMHQHITNSTKDPKEVLIRLDDAKELQKFLTLCHKKLVLKKSSSSDKCGFFRINGMSVVPYVVKEGTKYMPLFYFEGETDQLKLRTESVLGWDLAYLRFCCKVQGVSTKLVPDKICPVVALEDIKNHFPAETFFEDFWPDKGALEAKVRIKTYSKNQVLKKPRLEKQVQIVEKDEVPIINTKALNNSVVPTVPSVQPAAPKPSPWRISPDSAANQQLQKLVRSGSLVITHNGNKS